MTRNDFIKRLQTIFKEREKITAHIRDSVFGNMYDEMVLATTKTESLKQRSEELDTMTEEELDFLRDVAKREAVALKKIVANINKEKRKRRVLQFSAKQKRNA
jgi:DNA-directed RNA polymerase subunit F